MNRRLYIAACAVGLLCIGLSYTHPAVAQDRRASSTSIKVAYLYNFAKFVVWPKRPGEPGNGPIRICILAGPDFNTVARILEGKTIRGRPVMISLNPGSKKYTTCHLLYFDSSRISVMEESHEVLREHPILTVGEGKEFAEAGGIVHLMRVGDTIRFHIDDEAASDANLEISSRLLNLSYKARR